MVCCLFDSGLSTRFVRDHETVPALYSLVRNDPNLTAKSEGHPERPLDVLRPLFGRFRFQHAADRLLNLSTTVEFAVLPFFIRDELCE